MNIGDLVVDEWEQIAIVTSHVADDRWRIVYIRCGTEISAWGSNLYPIRSESVRQSNK